MALKHFQCRFGLCTTNNCKNWSKGSGQKERQPTAEFDGGGREEEEEDKFRLKGFLRVKSALVTPPPPATLRLIQLLNERMKSESTTGNGIGTLHQLKML